MSEKGDPKVLAKRIKSATEIVKLFGELGVDDKGLRGTVIRKAWKFLGKVYSVKQHRGIPE